MSNKQTSPHPYQLEHYWHFGEENSLWQEAVLCTVEHLAASLASAFEMPVVPSLQSLQPKTSPDNADYHLGGKIGQVETVPSGIHIFLLIVEPLSIPQDQNDQGEAHSGLVLQSQHSVLLITHERPYLTLSLFLNKSDWRLISQLALCWVLIGKPNRAFHFSTSADYPFSFSGSHSLGTRDKEHKLLGECVCGKATSEVLTTSATSASGTPLLALKMLSVQNLL